MRYAAELEMIRKSPDKHRFEPLSEAELQSEAAEGVPEDYLDFLREIGHGSVGVNGFAFYGGLVEVDEIMGHLYDDEDSRPELKDILLFGDNYSGDPVGFLTTDGWALVEIWHDDDLSVHYREEQSFVEFVKALFADYA